MQKTITRFGVSIACLLSVAGPLVACSSTSDGVPAATPSATPAPQMSIVEVAAAGDEFDAAGSLADWMVMQGDLITGEESTYDVGRTEAGSLTVVAGRVSWVDAHRGF